MTRSKDAAAGRLGRLREAARVFEEGAQAFEEGAQAFSHWSQS